MPGPVPEHGRHRREQHRRRLVRGDAGIGDAEIVDPVDLGIEPQNLAEGIDNADQEHADDQRVQPWVGHETRPELAGLTVEDHGEQDGEDQEQAHAPEKDLRAREFDLIGGRCHGARESDEAIRD